jgi:hypothetical protein
MQGPMAKLNKGEITAMNFKTMASQFSSTSNVCDAFLLRKMDINCENNKKNKN